MRIRWTGLVVVLVACGGGKAKSSDDAAIDAAIADAPIDMPKDASVTLVDAPLPDAFSACNPLTQAGCNAGEKCTWISDQDNPPIGHVGCAPEAGAPTAIGAACTAPPAGPMGYDGCIKGAVCLAGVCKQICDQQGGAPTCDQNHACTRYANFFESGGVAVAGVCDPGCDPLTQDLKVGTNRTACGAAIADAPNKGCYGYDDFSCAPASMAALTLTDRMPPQTNASGNPYLNGCAPGFIPFFYEGTGSTQIRCTGFCAALEMDNTTIGGLTPVQREDGDAAALGKLPTDALPVAGHATCAAGLKGSEASSECRFMWPYLIDNLGMLPAQFANGPLLDTLGVCMAISHFQYDSNADMVPDAPYPACSGLPRTGGTTDFDSADDWGCLKYSNTPMMFQGGKPALSGKLAQVRLPQNAPLELVRHSFD